MKFRLTQGTAYEVFQMSVAVPVFAPELRAGRGGTDREGVYGSGARHSEPQAWIYRRCTVSWLWPCWGPSPSLCHPSSPTSRYSEFPENYSLHLSLFGRSTGLFPSSFFPPARITQEFPNAKLFLVGGKGAGCNERSMGRFGGWRWCQHQQGSVTWCTCFSLY